MDGVGITCRKPFIASSVSTYALRLAPSCGRFTCAADAMVRFLEESDSGVIEASVRRIKENAAKGMERIIEKTKLDIVSSEMLFYIY